MAQKLSLIGVSRVTRIHNGSYSYERHLRNHTIHSLRKLR